MPNGLVRRLSRWGLLAAVLLVAVVGCFGQADPQGQRVDTGLGLNGTYDIQDQDSAGYPLGAMNPPHSS